MNRARGALVPDGCWTAKVWARGALVLDGCWTAKVRARGALVLDGCWTAKVLDLGKEPKVENSVAGLQIQFY